MTPTFIYSALVERVVDADTLDVDLDLGMRVHLQTRLRLDGIDAPELRTEEGKRARVAVVGLLTAGGGKVTVATRRPDKYGRSLARVTLPDGRDLSDLLIEQGHGVPYDGGAR